MLGVQIKPYIVELNQNCLNRLTYTANYPSRDSHDIGRCSPQIFLQML